MAIIACINDISRGQPLLISWLRDHLLPCPFKYITGLDCPGCGFQRAVLALAQGNFEQSFRLYPPAIPLLLLFIFGIADGLFKMDTEKGLLKKSFFILVGWMVLISYGFKLWHVYAYDSSPALAAATM
jgi:hypothetical protein